MCKISLIKSKIKTLVFYFAIIFFIGFASYIYAYENPWITSTQETDQKGTETEKAKSVKGVIGGIVSMYIDKTTDFCYKSTRLRGNLDDILKMFNGLPLPNEIKKVIQIKLQKADAAVETMPEEARNLIRATLIPGVIVEATAEAVKVGLVCPPGYNETSPGACYKPCDPGYRFVAGVCWKDSCEKGETDIGALCQRNSCQPGEKSVAQVCWKSCGPGQTDQGALCKINSCRSKEDNLVGGVCYKPCNPGDKDNGALCQKKDCKENYYFDGIATCWENCKPGDKNVGALCERSSCNPGDSNVLGVCYKPCNAGDKDNGALCQKTGCKENFTFDGIATCWEKCRSGETDIGALCKGANTCKPGENYLAGVCYKPCDQGDKDNGALCQKTACKENYSFDGIATCWEKCKPGDKDIGALCERQSCDPGDSKVLGVCYKPCNNGDKDNGALCQKKSCKDNYYFDGIATCWEKCKPGDKDNGALCQPQTCKPGYSYDGALLCKGECEKGFSNLPLSCYRAWLPKSKSRDMYGLSPYTKGSYQPGTYAKSSYPNTYTKGSYQPGTYPKSSYVTTRTKDSYQPGTYAKSSYPKTYTKGSYQPGTYAKSSYVTTIPKQSYPNTYPKPSYIPPMSVKVANCKAGRSNDAGLCYRDCPHGYKGVGPICWQKCEMTMLPFECAATCAKDQAGCDMKTFQMVVAPLEIVANVAMLVFTGGTANTAINQAKMAAKTAAKVAARTLAKQLAKNFAKNVIKKVVPQILTVAVREGCKAGMKKTQSAEAQAQWGDSTCQAAAALAGTIGAAATGQFGGRSFSALAKNAAKAAAISVAKVGIQRASQEACSRISDSRGSMVCQAGFGELSSLTDAVADPQTRAHNIKTVLRNFARKDLLHLGVQLGVKVAVIESCNAGLASNKEKENLPGVCEQIAGVLGGMVATGLQHLDDQAEQALPVKERKPGKPPKLKLKPPKPEPAPESVESIRATQVSTSLKLIKSIGNQMLSSWPTQGMAGEYGLPASNGVLTSTEITACKQNKNLNDPLCVLITLIAKANAFTDMLNYFTQYFTDKPTLASALVNLTDEYIPAYVSIGLNAAEVVDCIEKAKKNLNNIPKYCLLAAAITQSESAFTKVQTVVANTGFADDGGVAAINVDDSGSGVSLSMLEAMACNRILENGSIDLGPAGNVKFCKAVFTDQASGSGGSVDDMLKKQMNLSDQEASTLAGKRAVEDQIAVYREQLNAAPDFKRLSEIIKGYFKSVPQIKDPDLYADFLLDAVANSISNTTVANEQKEFWEDPKQLAYMIASAVDPVGVVSLVEAYDHTICKVMGNTKLTDLTVIPESQTIAAYANYRVKSKAKKELAEKCAANPEDPVCLAGPAIVKNDQAWVNGLAVDKKRFSYNLKITEPNTLDEWYWKLENGVPVLYVFAFEDQKEMRYTEREAMGVLVVPSAGDPCISEIINKATGMITVNRISQGLLTDWLIGQSSDVIALVANGKQLNELGIPVPKSIGDVQACLVKEVGNYKDTLKKIAADIINPPQDNPVAGILPPPSEALASQQVSNQPASAAIASQPVSDGVLTNVEINDCKKTENSKTPLCVIIALTDKAKALTDVQNYFSQNFSDKATLASALASEFVPFYESLGLLSKVEVDGCVKQATKDVNNVAKHCLLLAAIGQSEAAYTKILAEAEAKAAQPVNDKTYATFKDYCIDGNNIDPRSFCCLGYGTAVGCKATTSNDVKHIDMCKSVIAQASNANSECCKSANYLQICNIYKSCASMSNKKRSEYDAQFCNKTPKSK